MQLNHLLLAVPAAILMFGNAAAHAGKITNEEADIVCVIDKWDETEP